jgi:hypothetical protein
MIVSYIISFNMIISDTTIDTIRTVIESEHSEIYHNTWEKYVDLCFEHNLTDHIKFINGMQHNKTNSYYIKPQLYGEYEVYDIDEPRPDCLFLSNYSSKAKRKWIINVPTQTYKIYTYEDDDQEPTIISKTIEIWPTQLSEFFKFN